MPLTGPSPNSNSWLFFAILSAVFAGLTAILGKIGVEKINSDLATFIRTIVVLAMAALVVSIKQQWQPLNSVSYRTLWFLALSGIATGLSWLCYWRAMQLGQASAVAVIDKSSLIVVIVLAFIFFRPDREAMLSSWHTAVGGSLVTIGVIVIALGPKPQQPGAGLSPGLSAPTSHVEMQMEPPKEEGRP